MQLQDLIRFVVIMLTCYSSQIQHCDGKYTSEWSADIHLGGLFPVHARQDSICGKIQDLGIQRLEAMVFAVSLINEDSTLLPELTIGFDIRDTCTLENDALEEALNYVTGTADGSGDTYSVSGVIGAAASSVSIAVASLLRLFHVPQISYASTARTLSDKTRYDYFLRTIPPDLFQARVMVDLVLYHNWTYVIAISSDDTYGREGIAAFKKELTEVSDAANRTHCVATSIELELSASEQDYDKAIGYINKVWVSNASVVVLFSQLKTAEGILRAISRYGNHRPLTFIVSDAVGDQLPSKYHATAQGMISVLPKYSESRKFDTYFQSLKPSTNLNPWFREYWSDVFNCSFQSDGSRIKLCDETKQAISYSNGYKQNSKVSFVIDAVYAYAHAIHNLLLATCGEIKLCDEVLDYKIHGTVLNGALLRQFLYNVSFTGVSSVVSFDQSGDQQGGYWIKNLYRVPDKGKYEYKTVGSWDGTLSMLQLTSPIKWPTGTIPLSICSQECLSGQFPRLIENQAPCCWTCEYCHHHNQVSTGKECILCPKGYSSNTQRDSCVANPITYLTWSNPFSILILLLTMVGLICTTITAGVFIRNYKHKIVKASSRELSAALLCGIFICYLLPFFSIGKPYLLTCTIRRFGFGFPFSLCYAALLVKSNRIHRIFNRPNNSVQRPPLISPQSQLLFTALLVLIQVILSGSWLVIEIPGTSYKYKDDTTEHKCNYTPYIGLIISLGYNYVLLFISAYYAFRTRKIPQNFNEAKFINLTLYSIMIIWLAFIPAYLATASLGSIFQTSSQAFAIVLSASATLSCLFFPKLYFMFSAMRKESKRKHITLFIVHLLNDSYICLSTLLLSFDILTFTVDINYFIVYVM